MYARQQRELGSSHLPGERMIYCESVPGPVIQVFNMLLSNLVEPGPPLQVGVLECRSPTPCGFTNDNLRVVVLEDPEQAYQRRITASLPRQA